MLTPTIKNAIATAGLKRNDIAQLLNISPQAVSNKYTRDTFTGGELVAIAAACGYRLAFVDKQNNVISLFPEPSATQERTEGN